MRPSNYRNLAHWSIVLDSHRGLQRYHVWVDRTEPLLTILMRLLGTGWHDFDNDLPPDHEVGRLLCNGEPMILVERSATGYGYDLWLPGGLRCELDSSLQGEWVRHG